jgi:hypothetical protein
MYWFPGGAASVIVATFLIVYSLTKEAWFKGKRVDVILDRNKAREEIFAVESTEERQQEYIKLIQKISVAYENNNNSILVPNTMFFFFSFFLLFVIDFTAIVVIHFKNPDLIKNLFAQVYQSIVVNPGTFEEWFKDLASLGALHIFVLNVVFFLMLLGIVEQILNYRKLRLPIIGSPAFFQMPFFSVWLYIVSSMFFLITLRSGDTGMLLFVSRNLFFIFSTLYIFQGISILWLFLQVRLLPAAGIVIGLLVFAFMFQMLSVIIFSFFALTGLLDFWFDFRKKALHPNLFSDGV